MAAVKKVDALFQQGQRYPECGAYKVSISKSSHPADGMTANVSFGGGAVGTLINPQSFADGGPEWVARYGNVESIRYTIASLLETYDHLLSGDITGTEAARRLRLMRAVRRELVNTP